MFSINKLVALAALLCLSACNDSKKPLPENPGVDGGETVEADLVVLQANLGNLSLDCLEYAFNLCSVQVEERIASALATMQPDIVSLQELVSPAQCDELGSEPDATKVCHQEHRASEPAQVRRLLGPAYSIVCDSRSGFECVAIHKDAGRFEDCEVGALCFTADTADTLADCDEGFTVSAATVVLVEGRRLRLVNGHPPSGDAIECRRQQIERALVGPDALAPSDLPTLVAGDFNLDPFVESDASTDLWKQLVGSGRRFAYHSGPAEHEPPYVTSFSVLGGKTFDHVVSDFATGRCETLGEAPDSVRLDSGSGTDHRALRCYLDL